MAYCLYSHIHLYPITLKKWASSRINIKKIATKQQKENLKWNRQQQTETNQKLKGHKLQSFVKVVFYFRSAKQILSFDLTEK